MPEKTKRKANPRRRLLMRLIMGIAILTMLIAGAIQVLRPQGAQIVYIAHDDNRIEQIWLVNLNNPEHPRQLTDFDEHSTLYYLQIDHSDDLIFFVKGHTTWTYDLRTRQLRQISTQCDNELTCTRWRLHPDGERIFFFDSETDDVTFMNLYLFDFQTETTRLIFRSSEQQFIRSTEAEWVDDTDRIRMPYYDLTTSEDDGFIEFDTVSMTMTYIQGSYTWCNFLSPNTEYCTHANPHTDISDDSLVYKLIRLNSSDDAITIPPDYEENLASQNFDDISTRFYGWHPDSNQYLMTSQFTRRNDSTPPFTMNDLTLYNIQDSSTTVLTPLTENIYYTQPSFNADGSAIVIVRTYYHYITNSGGKSVDNQQIIYFDLITGEEIALPIFGTQPQLINSGE